MNTKILAAVLVPLLAAGCATGGKYRPQSHDKLKVYYADLRGDEGREVIETEDKTAAGAGTVITVRNASTGDPIDHAVVDGVISKAEFVAFEVGGRERIIVLFSGKDKLTHISVFQLTNEKLSKIFDAASAQGVETDFGAIPRIKIGRAPARPSPNLVPDWDTWVWSVEKFIKE